MSKKNGINSSLGYMVGKTNWYLKTHINKLLKEGGFTITSEQWLVLKVISFNPGLSQTEIAEKCMKDKTNITRILDLLEKKTYLVRKKDSMDRRMYRIHITDQGEELINAVIPITQKTDEICKEVLNDDELKKLSGLLDRICNNVKQYL
jgi:DNA-binding MarR family transcriptional regulator